MNTPASLIRQARLEAGLTQAELAERAGLSQPAVARLERPGSNPTVATLGDLLAASGRRLDLAAAPAPDPVDVGQIRERLRLTPAQRLAAFTASRRKARRLVSRARRVPG